MSNKWAECWKMCIRCKCTSEIKTPRRNNRVSPSDSIPVISVRPKIVPEDNGEDKGSLSDDSYSNGEINHQFNLQDESVESNRNVGDDVSGVSPNGSIPNVRIDPNKEDNLTITTVFIETGKGKQLRVVHYKSKDVSLKNKKGAAKSESSLVSRLTFENGKDNNENNDGSTNRKNDEEENDENEEATKEDEEEDEYWFSKWSRKPRFNSIFAKSTIHADDRRSSCTSVIDKNLEALQEADRIADGVIIEEDGEILQDAMDSIRWSKECSVINNSDNQNSSKVQNLQENHQDVGYTNLGFEKDDQENTIETETSKDLNEYNNGESESTSKNTENPSPKPPVSFLLGKPSNEEDTVCDINKSQSSIISSSMIELEVLREKSETLDVSSFKGNNDILNNSVRTLSHYISATPKLPVLFFIHGISGSSEVWKTQIDFFHNLGYEMVVPDLLGHGLSSTPSQPKHYALESLVQDLICVFDYFIRENVKTVVIGHGYGASLGTLLSRTRPKNIALLISISGGGPTPMVRPTCCQNSVLPVYCRLFHGKKRRGRFDNPELKHVLPKDVHKNVIAGQIWEDGDSAFHRRITIPTLLVYGMRDKVVNLVEECEMERTIPRAFLELITTAGHMVMWDEPHKLNKMLAKFIQSWG